MNKKVVLEILVSIMSNITSGFIAIILISPGILGVSSLNEYLINISYSLPLSIIGFFICYKLILEKNKYELKSE